MKHLRQYYIALLIILILIISSLVLLFMRGDHASESTFDAGATLSKITKSEMNDFLALESSITGVMEEYGLRSGFLLIDEAERKEVITNDQCHALLHYVGHEGYAENPYDFEKLTSIVEGTSCIGGFIHGIEAEIVLSSSNVKEDIWDFCSYAKKKGVSPGPCYHGVGHAASELYNYNIPKALELCDALAGGPENDLTNCYRGTFSELGNVIVGVDGHTGLPIESMGIEGLDENNPFTYCEQLALRHQSSCKSQLLKVLTSNYPMNEWLNLCNNPEFSLSSQLICANIAAGVYVRETLSFEDTTTLPKVVNELPEEARHVTVLGALEAFNGYAADNAQKDWRSFCTLSYEEQSDAEYCIVTFEDWETNGTAPWMERTDIR